VVISLTVAAPEQEEDALAEEEAPAEEAPEA
jgi:hypothetical protein